METKCERILANYKLPAVQRIDGFGSRHRYKARHAYY